MRPHIVWGLVAVLAAACPAPAAAQAAAQVLVHNTPLLLAGPPVVQAGQVMVPAARSFEAFGATATWTPAERMVRLSQRGGVQLLFRIGEPVVLVNGQARPLPAAPVVIGDQPYVPAAFVFAALGAWVRYDDSTRTLHVASQITALELVREPDRLRVVVQATGPLRVETRLLARPDRVVVDLHGGAFRLPDQELVAGWAGVVRVRAAQFQVKPYITRVVLEVSEATDVRVVPDAAFGLVIEARPRGVLAAPSGPGAPAAPPAGAPVPSSGGPPATPPAGGPPPLSAPVPWDDPHGLPAPPDPAPLPDDGVLRIQQVRIEQSDGRFRLLIEGTRPFEHTTHELPEPDRLVIDITGAVFVPVKQEIPVAGPVVAEVRAAQFQADPDITRVVVVFRRKAPYTVTAAGDGSTLVVEIPEPTVRGHVVAIDAGHGGRDTGAIGPTGLLEKDVVLDISLRAREALVRAGVRVVMTRETDVFVDLSERARLARRQGATVFVSIHANASVRATASGAETYYLAPQSQALAKMIQDELARIPGLADRGIKTANFLVLREAEIPAVLVEVAYISNPDEEARLRTPAFRQQLADAIARGVLRFLITSPAPAG
ncbi:MAG: N-acetylmuramoyl-L-alanine amidase family protein [Armatimonadota bacterium]|nr:N-acetylmuramoyl-L-alanine amidase family protein [Armatimonadota bacterium]